MSYTPNWMMAWADNSVMPDGYSKRIKDSMDLSMANPGNGIFKYETLL